MRTERVVVTASALVGGVFAANGWLASARRRHATRAAAPAGRPPVEPPRRSPGRTRAELYERAKELDLPGRSRMTKAELARAVAEADRPAASLV